MKRILIKNDIITGGGVEIVMRDLVNYLVDKGDSVTVVVDDGNKKIFYSTYPKQVKLLCRCYDGIKIKNIFHRFVNHFASQKYKKAYLKGIKKNYDVAIAIKDGPSMKYVSELSATKKIAWVHADYDYCHWSKSWYESTEEEKVCMSTFDNVVCVSEAVKRSVLKNVGDPNNLCVRLNPLNVNSIKNQAMDKIAEIKPAGKILFVSIGRLSEQKNYLQLIDAVDQVSVDDRKMFEIWIIGDGEQREIIETKLKEKRIDCIKILGWRTNPYPYLKMADCFLSVAIWESFGLAIQEAMILGIPVISTWWSALDEVFDERYGIITECNDKKIAESIIEIVRDQEKLTTFKKNINKYYDLSLLYEKRLENIYELIDDKK